MLETPEQSYESPNQDINLFSFGDTFRALDENDWVDVLNNISKKYTFDDLNWITTEDIKKDNKLEINWEDVQQLKEWESGYWFRFFQNDVFIWTRKDWRISGEWVAIYKNGNKYIWELSWWDTNNFGATSLNGAPYVLREWEWTTKYPNWSEYKWWFLWDSYTEWTFEYNDIKIDINSWKIKAWTNSFDLNEVFETKKVEKLCTISNLLKDTVKIWAKQEKKSNSDSNTFSSDFPSEFWDLWDFWSDFSWDNEIILEKKDWNIQKYKVDFIKRWVQKEVLEKWLDDYLKENNK